MDFDTVFNKLLDAGQFKLALRCLAVRWQVERLVLAKRKHNARVDRLAKKLDAFSEELAIASINAEVDYYNAGGTN